MEYTSIKIGLTSVLLVLCMTVGFAKQNGTGFPDNTPLPIQTYLKNSTPLSEAELKKLVINNSILGNTSHTYSTYELFFEKNGTVIFRKSRDDKQIYRGKYWIRGNHIFSQWKTYDKKSSVNEVQYFHIINNVYVDYNAKDACGPAPSYCPPFMVLKGDVFGLGNK